jgi:hypothetical protein
MHSKIGVKVKIKSLMRLLRLPDYDSLSLSPSPAAWKDISRGPVGRVAMVASTLWAYF